VALVAALTKTVTRKVVSSLTALAVAAGGGAAVDYSFDRPSTQSLQAQGVQVVARYLTGSGKALSKSEAATLHKAGLGIVLNFEQAAGNAKGGAAQGKIDGRAACSAASALGVPKGLPIYYSVDFDATASQLPTVAKYIKAAGAACLSHPARAYGSYAVCQYLKNWCWQTYAWSYGKVSKYAAFYQFKNSQKIGGAAVDYDAVLDVEHLGAWRPAAAKPAPPAKPAAAKHLTESTPVIYGVIKAGHHVGAKVTWSPRPSKIGYAWMANGKVVSHKAKPVINAKYAGQKLTVRVAANRPGYLHTNRTSKAVTIPRLVKTVTVRAGQSLALLAKLHKMSTAQVVKLNPKVKPPSLIFPGEKVRVYS
jgi:hypothetical protein